MAVCLKCRQLTCAGCNKRDRKCWHAQEQDQRQHPVAQLYYDRELNAKTLGWSYDQLQAWLAKMSVDELGRYTFRPYTPFPDVVSKTIRPPAEDEIPETEDEEEKPAPIVVDLLSSSDDDEMPGIINLEDSSDDERASANTKKRATPSPESFHDSEFSDSSSEDEDARERRAKLNRKRRKAEQGVRDVLRR